MSKIDIIIEQLKNKLEKTTDTSNYKKIIEFLEHNKDNINPMILNLPELTSISYDRFNDMKISLLDDGGIVISGNQELPSKEKKEAMVLKFSIFKEHSKPLVRYDYSLIEVKRDNNNMRTHTIANECWYSQLYNEAGIELNRSSAYVQQKKSRNYESTFVGNLFSDLEYDKPEFSSYNGFDDSLDRIKYDCIINRYRREESLGFYEFNVSLKGEKKWGFETITGNYPTRLPWSEVYEEYLKIIEKLNQMSTFERGEYYEKLISHEFNDNFVTSVLESEFDHITLKEREFLENKLNKNKTM